MRLLLCLFTLLLTPILQAGNSGEPTTPAPKSTPIKIQKLSTNQAVKQAENWFNSVTTLRADFSQTINNRTHTGKFYLSRPGKFLWQYTYPTAQKIVSTGAYVFFHDEETGQTTQVPRSMPLVRLLNAKNVSLNTNGFHPVSAKQSATTYQLKVALVTDNIEEGQFTLHFNKSPEALTHLTMTDALGSRTTIRLTNVRQGQKLSSKLFKFTPPQYEEN